MNNGLAIIEKTDRETRGFYIDQDTIECARLNALTKQRIANMESAQRKVDHIRRKEEKARAKRRKNTMKTFAHIFTSITAGGAVAWAGIAGMISPVIFIPTSILCLCMACLRLGAWFGRSGK